MRLQSKLLLAIVPVIAMALLTLGWVVYSQLRENSEEEVVRAMDLFLTQTLQQSQSFIDTARANAQLFSSSSLIEQYLISETTADRINLMQPALLKLFASYQNAYPEYREIRLILPNGDEDTRLAPSGLANRSGNEADSNWFRSLQTSGNSFLAQIGQNPDDGTATLLAVQAIQLDDRARSPFQTKPRPRGYLAITSNLEFLRAQVVGQSVAGSGYLLAAGRDGSLLFDQNGTVSESEFQQLLLSIEQSPGEKMIRINFKDVPMLLQSRWLDDELQLLAIFPESDLAAESHRLGIIVALVTLVAIYLTTLLFFAFLRSLVLGPLTRLRQMATAIGDGQLDMTIDIHRDDEIGELAAAFREMSSKLTISMRDQQRSHARIEQLAYMDSLTGLPNRRLFMDLVAEAINRRHLDESGLAVLFLDLDDFKRVNDTQGHDAGDVLLQEVARRLKNCVRTSDAVSSIPPSDDDAVLPIVEDMGALFSDDCASTRVARLGGDEFIILLPDLSCVSDATQVAERIIAALGEPITLNGRNFVVGTSIGIATYPADASDVDALIKCADTAMYEAKRHSKNTYRYYGDSLQFSIDARLELENDLRIALREDSFCLAYQPQYGPGNDRIVGVEALLRWTHPERGVVAPTTVIPVAEESGLIGELGEWVLREACRQWQEWNANGVAPACMAVNVSQRQFSLCNMVKVVTRALEDHSMPGCALELELTESCMMEAPADVVATLNVLRAMGVRVAMDDFGTGYSALSVLSALPLDRLKIDRSFIDGIEPDSDNDKIVSAVIMMARGLNLETVAEGVETDSELRYLRDRQCDVFQGYLLSRPLPAEKLTELLTQNLIQASQPVQKAS